LKRNGTESFSYPGCTALVQMIQESAGATYTLKRDLLYRLFFCVWYSMILVKNKKKAKSEIPLVLLLIIFIILIYIHTDLSMAGLPAELKHITQRRKRKQP
jgi:uncharacterized membrane protein